MYGGQFTTQKVIMDVTNDSSFRIRFLIVFYVTSYQKYAAIGAIDFVALVLLSWYVFNTPRIAEINCLSWFSVLLMMQCWRSKGESWFLFFV